MKVIVNKIIPYENMPTDKMHVHVLFVEDLVKYHRSCEVVVFLDKDDPRPLPVLKEEAVSRAYDFLQEVVSRSDLPRSHDAGSTAEMLSRQ